MTDRAVSSTLNYVLSLAIATLLVTGLLVTGGGFVDDRREQVIRGELEVIGQQVASDVQRADRLVVAGNGTGTEVRIDQSLPDDVTGSTYDVVLDGSAEKLVLTSTRPSVRVEVHLRTETTLGDSFADGGTVSVVYDSGELVIEDV